MDECDVRRNKESLDNNYILLTNSHMVEDRAGAILNVSTAHQMSQFEKALSKVGITKYHHLTVEEIRDNHDIVEALM